MAKIKKIITISILIVMLFPYTACLALTQAEAGMAIAQYAYNFCMTYGRDSGDNKTIYDHDNGGTTDRVYGYKLQLRSGIAQCSKGTMKYTNKYPMDCVGFVSMVLHQSLGIGSDSTFTFFITPNNPTTYGYFELATGGAQPGDIYRNSGHVMIYLGSVGGDKYIAESNAIYPEFRGPYLSSPNLSGYTGYRIKESIISKIDIADVKSSPSGAGLTGNSTLFNHIEQSEFYYNGIPDGKYSVVSGNIFDWIVNALKDVFNFIVSLLAYLVRMVFVGWTFLIENLLTDTVKRISGEDDLLEIDATDYGEDGNQYTDDNITIEKIIFNDVKIFNVDFFNVEEPVADPD